MPELNISKADQMPSIIIHYSEIALKGLNRSWFEGTLTKNISESLGNKYPTTREDSRIILIVPEEKVEKVKEKLTRIFGIAWFSVAYGSTHDINELKNLVLERVNSIKSKNDTFRIEVKRAYKKFPLGSIQLSQQIAEHLYENGVSVSPINYTKILYIEVLEKGIFLLPERIEGLNGLPTGTSGKCIHLLSGGIDSPVAAWLLMKRGIKPVYLHFHPFRDNEGTRKAEKIIDQAKLLSKYSLGARLYLIPFYPFQIAALKIPQRNAIILFRRLMLKIAERIAKDENAVALSTGESVAQVASQTLPNIAAIEEATQMPILRPLITYDKNEIIDLAKKLGTFDISMGKYNDCCISLISNHPVLKASPNTIKENEEKININSLVDEMLSLKEVVKIAR